MTKPGATPGAGGYFDLGGCIEQAEVCEYEMTPDTIKKAQDMPTLQEWEQRVDATVQLLGRKKLLTVDMMRRGIEALPIRSAKEDMSYYVKWAASVTSALREAGVLSEKDIRLAIGDVTDGETGGAPPKFEAGASVRVRAEHEAGKTRWRKPYVFLLSLSVSPLFPVNCMDCRSSRVVFLRKDGRRGIGRREGAASAHVDGKMCGCGRAGVG